MDQRKTKKRKKAEAETPAGEKGKEAETAAGEKGKEAVTPAREKGKEAETSVKEKKVNETSEIEEVDNLDSKPFAPLHVTIEVQEGNSEVKDGNSEVKDGKDSNDGQRDPNPPKGPVKHLPKHMTIADLETFHTLEEKKSSILKEVHALQSRCKDISNSLAGSFLVIYGVAGAGALLTGLSCHDAVLRALLILAVFLLGLPVAYFIAVDKLKSMRGEVESIVLRAEYLGDLITQFGQRVDGLEEGQLMDGIHTKRSEAFNTRLEKIKEPLESIKKVIDEELTLTKWRLVQVVAVGICLSIVFYLINCYGNQQDRKKILMFAAAEDVLQQGYDKAAS